uniref:C-type lectin domain-containing protein n=1 Tax=Kryptolebias marmoratus TaxID=37003 RepID=A0A3Q3AYH6_KRYMA
MESTLGKFLTRPGEVTTLIWLFGSPFRCPSKTFKADIKFYRQPELKPILISESGSTESALEGWLSQNSPGCYVNLTLSAHQPPPQDTCGFTYCRQKHTDLVTIRNSEEINQLTDMLSSAGHRSEVWIGLFSEIDWKWSDGFTGSGAEYRNWETTVPEPNFSASDQFCVLIGNIQRWSDYFCMNRYRFVCYKDEFSVEF